MPFRTTQVSLETLFILYESKAYAIYSVVGQHWRNGAPAFPNFQQIKIHNTARQRSIVGFLFVCNRGDTMQYHGSLQSRELDQAPMLLVFHTPRQALSSHLHQQMV